MNSIVTVIANSLFFLLSDLLLSRLFATLDLVGFFFSFELNRELEIRVFLAPEVLLFIVVVVVAFVLVFIRILDKFSGLSE